MCGKNYIKSIQISYIMSEADCQIVSSRGIMKSCSIYSVDPHSSIRFVYGYFFNSLKEGDSIYVCSSAIPHFIQETFPKMKKFILVTGDCDESCPTDLFHSEAEFLQFIESDKIIHWYSQNCVREHPKLTKIPIGMDYHTLSTQDHEWGAKSSPLDQEKIAQSILSMAKPISDRKLEAYSNFHFKMDTKFSGDRREAIQKIPRECIFYETEKVDRLMTWKTQSEYAFVASPHGNGLDCHRTWEALALGCIPIVKTSPIDSVFLDLPVWIVKDWSDVNSENMKAKVEEFKDMMNPSNLEKLSMAYWKNLIHRRNSFSPSPFNKEKVLGEPFFP